MESSQQNMVPSSPGFLANDFPRRLPAGFLASEERPYWENVENGNSLGEGGHGSVYPCRNQLGEAIVIKIVKQGCCSFLTAERKKFFFFSFLAETKRRLSLAKAEGLWRAKPKLQFFCR